MKHIRPHTTIALTLSLLCCSALQASPLTSPLHRLIIRGGSKATGSSVLTQQQVLLRGSIATTLGRRLDTRAEELLMELSTRNASLAAQIARSPKTLHALEKYGNDLLIIMERADCAPLLEKYGQEVIEPLMKHPTLTREILTNGGEALLPKLHTMSRKELRQAAVRLRKEQPGMSKTDAYIIAGSTAAGMSFAGLSAATTPEKNR